MGELIPLFPLGTPLFPGVVLPMQIFEPRYRRLMHDLLAQPEDSDRRFFGVVAIRQGWEVEQVAPAEALYDIGCTARLRVLRPQPDGGFQIVTVGGRRFRLLDVVVGEDPPYLQAEVEWLSDEEAAEEAAGDHDFAEVVRPVGSNGRAAIDEPDEVSAAVARGSLGVLAAGVRELFTQYVAAVAEHGAAVGAEEVPLSAGDAAEAVDAGTAILLEAVRDDPTALSYLVASTALFTTEDRQGLLAESATRRRLAAESRLLRRELTLLRTLGAVPVPLQRLAVPMAAN